MRSPVRPLLAVAALALLASCGAPPPATAPLPLVHSPEDALSTARAFAAGREFDVAERLLAAHTLPAPRTDGSEALMNSRVLQLRAQIASQTAATVEQWRRAEALAAWAVWESPLTADAWITYAEVRRRADGYATFVAAIEAREIQRYDGADVGAPRVLARLPDVDEPSAWLFLRALVQSVEGQTDDALATLRELRRVRQPCHAEHLEALLNARNANWDALRDNVSVLENSSRCADVRGSPSYQRARARLALASGNRRLALETLREAQRIDPSNPEVGAELAALQPAGGVIIQAEALGSDELYRVRANPNDWSTWAALWRATGMESPARGGAFLSLAEETVRSHQTLVAPRLALALAHIRGADFGGASVALGPLRSGDARIPELLECRLVLALALGDARTIRAALDDYQRTGAPLAADAASGWGDVLRHAERPPGDPARRAAAAVFLERASRRDGSRLFIGAGASSFISRVLPETPGGQAVALALLEGRTDLLGHGISELDRRVERTETELSRLNEYAVALASRVTGLQAEQVRQAREIRLAQAQVRRLESEISRVAQELPRMEARLVQAMERGDERILRIVDQMSAEVRANRDELRAMGLRLDALAQGRTASKRALMADILTIAGAALSWSPGGRLGFNLIGLLTGIGAAYLTDAGPHHPWTHPREGLALHGG